MPLLPSLTDALNNTVNSLNTLTDKEAVLDTLPVDLGTAANNVVNTVESTLKAVSELSSNLSKGAPINSVSAVLLPVVAELKTVAATVALIGKPTTNELSQTLTALSTGFEQLAVQAVNPLTIMNSADLLPILNPIADDLTNLGGDLVEGLVGGTTLDNLVNSPSIVNDLVSNLGNKLNGVVTDAATIRQNLSDVVNGLSTTPPLNQINVLNSAVDDTLELVEDLLSLPNPDTSVETLISGLNVLADDINNAISNITDGSVPTGDELTNSLKPAVDDVAALVDILLGSNGTGSLIDSVVGDSALVDNLVNDLGNQVKPVTDAVDDIVKDLLGVGNNLQDGTPPQDVVGTLNGVVNDVQNLVSDLANNGSDSANTLINGLQDVIGKLNGTVTDITDGSVPVASDLLGTINPLVDDLQDLSTALIKTDSTGSGSNGGGTGGSTGGSTGGTNSNGGSTGGANPNGGSTGGTNSNGGSTGGINPDGGSTGGTNPNVGSTGGTNPNGGVTDNSSKPQPTEGDDSLVTTSNKDDFNMRGGSDKVTSTYANLQQQDVIDGGVGIDKLLVSSSATTDFLQLQVASGANSPNLRSGMGNGTSISNFEQFDLTGFAGRANVRGANTADSIIGGSGSDQLVGVAGNDQLIGGASKDKLLGGAGNDYLMGGVGKDRIVGSKGKDRFAFASTKDNMDIITDFNGPSDSIVILKQGFGGDLAGKKLFKSQFVLGSQAQDKNDRFIYNGGTGVLSFDVDGAGGQKQVAIAKLSNRTNIAASDIIFA